jgi:hypothetical protein
MRHVLPFALLLLVGAEARAACTGDCNDDRAVAINELLAGVNISLGSAAMSSCMRFDSDGDARVSVAELVRGVNNALHGCVQQRQAFIVTSDFGTGSFATVGLDPPRPVMGANPSHLIHRDAVVRARDGLVYVLNRLFADNLQVLDPAQGFATRMQCSTGNGTNPHDIAFVNDRKAYITLFERSTLLIVDPTAPPNCAGFTRDTIDLSGLADADGNPDMDQMAVVGGRLYVALQRLDINTILRVPAQNAALAVIDIASDSVVGGIELSGENPFAATKGLTAHDGAIYVAQAGFFGVMDGGIERVDLDRQQAEGFLVTEEDLGGDITDFVVASEHRIYAIISRRNFSTALIAFDPTTRQITGTLREVSGYTLFDIELNDRGELFLADRTRGGSGVRIYRASDGVELTEAPLNLVLPPFEIVFVP